MFSTREFTYLNIEEWKSDYYHLQSKHYFTSFFLRSKRRKIWVSSIEVWWHRFNGETIWLASADQDFFHIFCTFEERPVKKTTKENIYFGAVYIRLRIKISPELFCYAFFFIGRICYTWRIDSSLMFTQVPHFNLNRPVIDMFLCENLVRLNCVFLIFSWPDKVKYSDVCDLRVRLWLSDCFDRDLVTWGENVRIIDFHQTHSGKP